MKKKWNIRNGVSRRDFIKRGAIGMTVLAVSTPMMSLIMKQKKLYGITTEYMPLKRVLVHAPSPSVGSLITKAELVKYNFEAKLDHKKALNEHKEFVKILLSHGVEVIEVSDVLAHDEESLSVIQSDPNFMFTRDIMTMTPNGALLSRMGLESRMPQVAIIAKAMKKLGIPIVGQLKAPAMLEGGGVAWLDAKTLIIGMCDRANEAAVDQLQSMIPDIGIESIIVAYLSAGTIHVDGTIAIPGTKTAFVTHDAKKIRSKVVTATNSQEGWFLDELEKRDINIFPFDEICNTIYTAPFRGVAVEAWANPAIKAKLVDLGGKLDTFEGDELIKGYGGAHCMTCPILRG